MVGINKRFANYVGMNPVTIMIYAHALANGLQMFNLPSELIGTIPYVTTVIVLVLYAMRMKRKIRKRQAYADGMGK